MSIVAEEKQEIAASAPLDDMGQYLQDIRSFPLLTAQEERELTLRCARGDEDAIRLLVCSNLRLVVSMAGEYSGRGVPLLDLVQEGSIGLVIAAKKFDPELGFRFSTYASKWIRRGIFRCLIEHNALIRIPEYTSEKIQKIFQAQYELAKILGETPSVSQLAQKLEMPEDKVQQLLQLVPQIQSIDECDGEDELSSPPQEQLVREELARIMESLLARLDERQRMILRLHFGMEDGVCHSLESIAQQLELSKERVRQIKNQAMEKLKKSGISVGLEEFLNE